MRTRYERTVRGYTLERCTGCGLVFANPQWPQENLLSTYEDRRDPAGLIAFYARVTTPERLACYDQVLDQLEALLPGRGRLLDFGCGAGYFFERAARRGWEAHGVEVGDWAQQAAKLRGLANLHKGLLVEQRFPDGCFDVVCAHQVLEHLPTPKKDLAQIRRVLRPQGLFYASVPNYRCLSIVLGRDDFELNYPLAHVNYFGPGALRNLLQACGFRVLRTTTAGGLKWENLLGRPTASEESRAHRGEPQQPQAPSPRAASVPQTQRSPFERWFLPVVKKCLYQWAKVGMNLEIYARKP
jgi:SAM-dependent methyltransferase